MVVKKKSERWGKLFAHECVDEIDFKETVRELLMNGNWNIEERV